MRFFKVCKAFANQNINLPKRATKGSAGYDLEAAIDVEIKAGEIVLVPTGLKVSMDQDDVLLVYPRSSLALKKGVMMANNVGVVDSDYYDNPNNEGHLMVPLYNFRTTDVSIQKGERIAQGIFQKYGITQDDEAKGVRAGGFGSSGN